MKIKLIFIFFVFGLTIQGQNSLKGIVLNENQEPIENAEVYIELLHIGTTTEEDGSFVLKNIPKGNHKLTVNYLGYDTKNINIQATENDLEINIKLLPTIFHMDEVILSTPFHRLQSENVMKIESKSIQSLQKNGAPTLIESLTSIPGVEQFSTGTGIGKPVIRGLTGNRVLVYTQGVRLENQQFGDEHGLGLNESGIESVEIIKGPASLLYGSDALGGVLYFNPEKFAYQNDTKINISQDFFSNTLGSATSVGVKTSKDIFKFLVRGTYNTHSDYEIPNGDRITNTRFNEKDLKLGLGLNLNNYVSEIRYNYNDAEIGITEGINDQSTSKTLELPYQDIQNHIISLHNHFFLNKAKIDLNLGYVINNRKEFEEHEEEDHGFEPHEEEEHMEAALDMKLQTFTYDAKYYFPNFKKFETIMGVQGMFQSNKNFGEEILIPDATTNDIGFLATSIYNMNDKSLVQAGLRYDHRNLSTDSYEIHHHEHDEDESHEGDEIEIVDAIDKTYGNFTFSLGYKTKIFDKIVTRLNLASGFRAPNLAELTSYGVHHGTNRFEIGNPNLESERNFQTDLSLEYGNEHFEIFANGFYNSLNNYIYASPTGEFEDDYAVYEYIQNDAELYGGEFGIHLHPHPLDWLHLESNFEMVIGKQKNGDYLPLIPANKWSNTVRGEFAGNKIFDDIYLAMNLDSFFDQNKTNDFEANTEGYNLLNFRSGGNINFNKVEIQINFSINNLLDKEYISHLSALKIDEIPNPGRNFVLGLNFTI
ncbi:TonB-dependent receptor [Namhaeicola litoreus]|uniref:TonB-dependent receptor domain-containing protein n=1 Tax=Namhaeicola litoreus TaxID=1052145 RepID=A0ABW3Y219_9FLAO